MIKLWNRYNAWRSRRQQLSLARWAEEREKGKARFVLYEAFSFAVIMTASRDVINQFLDDHNHIFGLWSYLVVYGVGGIFVAFVGWSQREGKYKSARLNARLQTPLNDRIRPR